MAEVSRIGVLRLLRGAIALALAALVGAAGCATTHRAAPGGLPAFPPQVEGKAAVAAAHPLASRAGAEVLQAGGNAVDAAVATAFALAVVEPYSSGLGGGGFAVVYDPRTRHADSLDFRETAPAAATRDMFVRNGRAVPALSRTGGLSVGTPGEVAGLWALHRRLGHLAWRRVVEPAVRLARDGFPVDARLHRRIARALPRFNDAARRLFAPHGAPLAVGAKLVQPALASLLAAIAERGPDAFYRGEVAARIARTVQAAGGILTQRDLEAYRPQWRSPVHGSFRDLAIVSMGPPSSGGVLLVEMLNILEGWGRPYAPGPDDVLAFHRLVEAMKFAYADRARYLGDPDFVDVPVERLTSKSYADALRERIRDDRALPADAVAPVRTPPDEGAHTTHLSVVDARGMAVAMTLTINLTFGSGLVAGGTGVVLNDEMDDFAAAPGAPNAFGLVGGEANAVAPGKRPLSSMTPTIVVRDGEVVAALGSPGGSRIITAVLQTILGLFEWRRAPWAAVASPRIHHQWLPPAVFVEAGAVPPAVRAALEALGHHIEPSGPMGNVQLVVRDPDSGRVQAASDPRGIGAPASIAR